MEKIFLTGSQVFEIAEEIRRCCAGRKLPAHGYHSVYVTLTVRGGRLKFAIYAPKEDEVSQ